ncbi:hypothetical protein RHO12_06760 [Orbus sturtevantii]|uniref:RCC1 domain-containing protein n=1 Tax=Orbus sturtevantii TaxID=3074109 RepID=UPI00370D4B5C
MIRKVIPLLLINLLITSAYAQTDAVLLSKKITAGGSNASRVHAVDTGVTIENGDVWIWGFRNSGQQGNGRTDVHPTSLAPARVMSFVQNGLKITHVTGGAYHLIALDSNGDVWGWGQNGYHEAGAGVCSAGYVNTPCRILKDQKVIQIGAGEYVSYALTKGGDVYAWGHGIYGQVGNGGLHSVNNLYKIPQSYFNNRKVVLLGAAYEGAYAINEDGEVFGWGDEQANSFGYSNKANHIYVKTPKKLNIPSDVGRNITHICGGEAYTQYLTTEGKVYGIGEEAKLGRGKHYADTTSRTATPVEILTNVKELYCRFAGSVAIKNNDSNHIYTWGSNGSNDPYYIYGSSVTSRTINGELIRIDGGKENLYYLNSQGNYYGIGYGAANKLDDKSVRNVRFPGNKMSFLENEVKNTYGADYIMGQGYK